MKILLVLRHAKSSWDDPARDDHDRPLSKRGKRDAPRMAELILREHLCPDVILSSSARRARKTAEAVQRTCGESVLTLHDDLYLAEPAKYIARLRELPEGIVSALVVGHNPGLEELIAALGIEIDSLPTCTLAHCQLPIDSWSDLTAETPGTLIGRWKPRDLE